MRELWVKKVVGDGDSLVFFASTVNSLAPSWFLHGITALRSVDDENEDVYIACLWGETDFMQDGKGLTAGVSFCDESLSVEEMNCVLEAAALQACHIALLPENFVKWGEILLNMHPECRGRDTEMEAYIDAALQERNERFTDEDYEGY